ncbi:MAG: hypothetical protein ACYSX1_11100 [Planctomycetota bacterium]|jgi:hypothetical protein
MIPYGYRRLRSKGLDDAVGVTIWGRRWPELKEMTLSRLKVAVAVDVGPIGHILFGPKAPTINLFPPWRTFYFEWHRDSMHVGLLVDSRRLKTDEAKEVLRALKHHKTDAGNSLDGGWAYDVGSIMYGDTKRGPALSHIGEFYVRHDGGLVMANGQMIGKIAEAPGLSERLRNQHVNPEYSLGCSCNYQGKIIRRFISFMQCRNIKAKRKHYPDFKPRKKQRHKVYKYYELTVVKPSIVEINQPHGEGVKGKALHSVRGHTMHFAKEKPMFGNPRLYGTFFVPQHVRGDIKHGKVEKSYATKGRY